MGGGPLELARRRAQSMAAMVRVRGEVAPWLARWKQRPAQDSQLARLHATLTLMLARLSAIADGVATDERGFRGWQGVDFHLAMIERLWWHYRDRLAPRLGGDAAVERALAAADDVIWSCAEVSAAMRAGEPPPLPLACFEPTLAANAPPRESLPPGTQPRDAALAACVALMPVPLIAVTTAAIDEPWWLALLAHETGHHVQYDLEPAQALVERTGALLAQHGGARWTAWRKEVFADAFAIATLGPEANDVIAALEWGAIEELTAERGGYPPVVVRLAIGAELAKELGFAAVSYDGAAWRPRLPELVDERVATRIAADLERIGDVDAGVAGFAKALAQMIVGDAALRDAPRRTVAEDLDGAETTAYAAVLEGNARVLTPHRRKSRLVAATSFRAFRVASATADLGPLRDRALGLFAQVRDTTTKRAAAPVKAASEAVAASMWAAVETARAEELP